MPKTRVLIIDEDTRTVQSAREYLLNFGFEVNSLGEFKDTRFLKDTLAPHLVIVDPSVPGANGLNALHAIRKESKVPVIITSAKDDVTDRVVSLEAGADDYLVKPYEPRELVARINTIFRRSPAGALHSSEVSEVREWCFKGLTVQSNRRRILLDEQTVELTTAEFDLLRLLVSNAQQVLSRETILDRMRGIEWEAVDRSVDILVSRLRVKLNDDPRNPRFIRTIRSVGYQFVGEAVVSETTTQAHSKSASVSA